MFEILWIGYAVVYGVSGLLLTELIGALTGNPLRWPYWGRAVFGPLGVVLLVWDAFVVSAYTGDE